MHFHEVDPLKQVKAEMEKVFEESLAQGPTITPIFESEGGKQGAVLDEDSLWNALRMFTRNDFKMGAVSIKYRDTEGKHHQRTCFGYGTVYLECPTCLKADSRTFAICSDHWAVHCLSCRVIHWIRKDDPRGVIRYMIRQGLKG